MRIAYVAPYQGPTLLRRRPVVRNLSLGARSKIELIAELLHRRSHSVEILSQGEVIERECKFFPGFQEEEAFHPDIPIYYAGVFPVRFLNGFYSSSNMLRLLKARHRIAPFDLVLIYNLKPPQVACANYAMQELGVPVILEYEDNSFFHFFGSSGTKWTSEWRLAAVRRLLASLSGCIAGSTALLDQVTSRAHKLLLPGVVSEVITQATTKPISERENWAVFSGTHSQSLGIENLVKAWVIAKVPGWQLHLAGEGDITPMLRDIARNDSSVVFHGILDYKRNAELLGRAKITVVPNDVTKTIGFSFKTVECLAAGMHVITTRLTSLENLPQDLKDGLTYLDDNQPETIAESLRWVIAERGYERTVQKATLDIYGPDVVSETLDRFVKQVKIDHTRCDSAVE